MTPNPFNTDYFLIYLYITKSMFSTLHSIKFRFLVFLDIFIASINRKETSCSYASKLAHGACYFAASLVTPLFQITL